MTIKNIKESQLNKLLDEVAADLNKTFGDVKEKLSKSDVQKDEGFPEASPEAEKEAIPEASESATPDAPSAPPEQAEAAPEAQEAGDPAQEMGGELTPEALQAEYEKLPPEELQMHKMALEAALAKMSPPPEAAPAMPSPSAPPEAPAAPAMKSEKQEGEDLAKSEVASLKEDIEILAKAVKALIETPVRKAITSLDELSKSEEPVKAKSLSPAEFWSKLKEVSKRSNLKKSDKQLIVDIYEKRVSPEVVAKHLSKLFSEE
jgi:hypothetical protein